LSNRSRGIHHIAMASITSPAAIPDEAQVEIYGLVGAKELNGRRGRIVKFVEDTQRFAVQLDGEEETKGVKPENLRRCLDAPSPEQVAPAPTTPVLSGEAELASPAPVLQTALEQPLKPKTAFFCFLAAARADIVAELDTRNGAAVSKRAAERWREMTADDKAPYDSQAAAMKKEYEAAVAEFLAQGGTPKKRKCRTEEQTPTKLDGPPQPLRPKTAFFCFLDSARAALAEELGSAKGSLVVKAAAQRWNALSDELKAPFEQQAADLRRTYEEDVASFLAGGGTLQKRKSKVAQDTKDSVPGSPDSPDGAIIPVVTPKKKKPRCTERARQKVSAYIRGIPSHGLLQGDERVLLRRDRRAHSSSTAIAAYDASLGGHIGYIGEDVASSLAPLLDRHPALRVSGRVLGDATSDDTAGDDVDGLKMLVELLIVGPVDLSGELEAFGAAFDSPQQPEGDSQTQSDGAAFDSPQQPEGDSQTQSNGERTVGADTLAQEANDSPKTP